MSFTYTAAITTMARVTALLALASLLYAGTIAGLTPAADAIVVGSISARFESLDNVSFDIVVDRVLKGRSVPAVVHVEHAWHSKIMVSSGAPLLISKTFCGIWFLQRVKATSWDILVVNGPDGFFPALFWPAVAALPENYQYPPATSVTDALTLEVAGGAHSNPEVLLYALHALDSPAVEMVLNDFLDSPDSVARSAALAALLERSQAGALARAAQEWPAISKNERSKFLILNSLEASFRPQDPNSVREVAAMARASTTAPELRAALVRVLVAIHTQDALPFLASLLKSDDRKEQMTGVFALALFANGNPAQTPQSGPSLAHLMAPSSAPYQTPGTLSHMGFRGPGTPEEEADLVSFWTGWWASHPELH